MAHYEGGTALHSAASHGHLSTVAWLLKRGAHLSLRIKNKLGKTPIDFARMFGPHPEVEALLGSAMLDVTFHSRYMLRRGSVELRRTITHRTSTDGAGATEDEDGDDAATTDVLHLE